MRPTKLEDQAQFYGASASQLQAEGRYSEAEPEYLRAFCLYEKAGLGETVDVATLFAGLGIMHLAQARKQEAGANLDRALAILDRANGDFRTDRARILGIRASLHVREGKWKIAEAEFKTAISIADCEALIDPSELRQMLVNYAYVLRKFRRGKEARSLNAQAAAIQSPAVANAMVDISGLRAKSKGSKPKDHGVKLTSGKFSAATS